MQAMMPELQVNQIIQGDCIDVMSNFPDKCIDLIIADPPYNIAIAQWDVIEDYSNWMISWIKCCERVLKDNGSMYIFHSEMLSVAKLMVEIKRQTQFRFRQFIVWNKKFRGSKNEGFLQGFLEVEGLRNYQQMAEYILYYTFECDIREYLRQEAEKAGLKTLKEINQFLGTADNGGGVASACFSAEKTDWLFPTREIYFKLQSTGYFQKDYDDLAYVFNNSKRYHSVWQFDFEEGTAHMTPKPIKLLRAIIEHSSNEGQIVLDPFAGSGSSLIAAHQLRRKWIGIESLSAHVAEAQKRLDKWVFQERLI